MEEFLVSIINIDGKLIKIMSDIKNLFINNNDIKLEAELYQSTKNPKSFVLLIHPHPEYGGSMFNNIVSEIFKKCIENDISALRFNFRAVGASTGNHTSGSGELSDVKACVDYLINEVKKEAIFLCGYSYGAAIGCSVVNYNKKIIGYAAISFPWDAVTREYKELSQSTKPKLFIQGDRDNIANINNFDNHYAYYTSPKQKLIIKGADHFYWGYEKQVADKVVEFYKKSLTKQS